MRDPQAGQLMAPKSTSRPLQKCHCQAPRLQGELAFSGANDSPPFLTLAGIFCCVVFHGPWEK